MVSRGRFAPTMPVQPSVNPWAPIRAQAESPADTLAVTRGATVWHSPSDDASWRSVGGTQAADQAPTLSVETRGERTVIGSSVVQIRTQD